MWRTIEAWLGQSDAQLVELGLDVSFAILLSLIVTTSLRLVIEFL